MEFSEGNLHVRHVHVEQRHDASTAQSAIRLIVYFENLSDVRIRFDVRRMRLNGAVSYDNLLGMGGTVAKEDQNIFPTPFVVIPEWNVATPAEVIFSLDVAYGYPDQVPERILHIKAVVEILAGPNNVELELNVADRALGEE